MAAIVQVNPAFASEHQMAVVECLGDPDETLQRITLELLFTMTALPSGGDQIDLKSLYKSHLELAMHPARRWTRMGDGGGRAKNGLLWGVYQGRKRRKKAQRRSA